MPAPRPLPARRLATIALAMAGAVSPLRAEPPLAAPPAGSTGAPAEPVKRKVLHLRLTGDLDNTRLVRQFGEVLATLKPEGVEVLVLELGGNRFRTDTIADLIRAARSAGLAPGEGAEPRTEWIVWLNDPADGRVGAGAAALGAVADRCYLGPKVEVAFDVGDDERELAPAGAVADWGAVEQEVQAALWGRLKARGGDLLLAAALPCPRQALWSVTAGGACRLVAAPPASESPGAAVAVVTAVPGADTHALRLRLDAQTAQCVGLASGQAKELGQILAARRISPRPLIRKDLESGLAAARKRLFDEIAAVDAARERLDKELDAAERLRGQEAKRKRDRTGREMEPVAVSAAERLTGAERLCQEYPELLRLTPPGHTAVGLVEAKVSQEWSYAFQSRRTALTELKNRAARLRD